MIQRTEPIPTGASPTPIEAARPDARPTRGRVELADARTEGGPEGPAAAPDEVRARALVIEIGRALHAAGSPSDRTESLLEEAASRCGLAAVFFVTPTSIMASFADGTRVVRGDPGDVDLGRMTALEAVVTELAADRASIAAAETRLAAAITAAPRYGRWTTRLSFGGAGLAAGVVLGGSAPAAITAAAMSCAVGLGLELAATRPRLARAFLVLTSALVAVLSSLIASALGTDGALSTLAGLIVLLPGLSLTLAMRELAARHLVSGGARLMGAAVDFVAIGFGMALGERVAAMLVERIGPAVAGFVGGPFAIAPWPSLDPAWRAAALVVAPLTFVVLFRAPARAIAPIIGICLVGWTTASSVAEVDARLAPMLAAAAAGLLANASSRVMRMPAAVFLVPGIMLLVPGVLGMRSLDAMMDSDPVGGVATAVGTVLVGTGIAAGLLVANAVLPPRGSRPPVTAADAVGAA